MLFFRFVRFQSILLLIFIILNFYCSIAKASNVTLVHSMTNSGCELLLQIKGSEKTPGEVLESANTITYIETMGSDAVFLESLKSGPNLSSFNIIPHEKTANPTIKMILKVLEVYLKKLGVEDDSKMLEMLEKPEARDQIEQTILGNQLVIEIFKNYDGRIIYQEDEYEYEIQLIQGSWEDYLAGKKVIFQFSRAETVQLAGHRIMKAILLRLINYIKELIPVLREQGMNIPISTKLRVEVDDGSKVLLKILHLEQNYRLEANGDLIKFIEPREAFSLIAPVEVSIQE